MKECKECKHPKLEMFFENDSEICIKCTNLLKKKPAKTRYTVDDATYRTLYDIQDGKCAICQTDAKDQTRRMCVDYDPKTLLVRGLLCTGCNASVGQIKERYESVLKILQYTQHNPGKILQNSMHNELEKLAKMLYTDKD